MNLTGQLLGQYQIRQPIGSGGMAQVYLAVQPALNRNVAVKVLAPHLAADPGFVTRFRREATLVAGLLHPNILPVHDFGEERGVLYLVMAYVPGGTLFDRMDTPMDWDTIVRVVSQIADALDSAHQQSIVHRDLKPGNILMVRPDYPLVGDFGIARLIQEGGLTRAGTTIGTPEYMSPEQGMGQPVDGRSDIYSLGIILYQLLTGRVPFAGDSDFAIIQQHVYQPLPPPSTVRPGIPPGLEAVTVTALAKRPEDRFQTAGQMRAALNSSLTAPVRPLPEPRSIAEPGRRGRLPLVLGAIAGLVALLLVIAGGAVAGRALFTQVRQSSPGGTPGSSATVPANLPTAIPVGQVIFEDTMRADQGRWPVGRTADRQAAFVNGAYQLQTLGPSQTPAMVALGTQTFASFAYEAELRKTAGRNDAGYGIAFRVHGTDEWYDLLITGDQRYCLSLWVASLKGYDALIPCTPSTAINAGDAANRLKVVTRGPEMVIYINDQYVAQTTETRSNAPTVGQIGLTVSPGVTMNVNAVRVFKVG